MNCMFTLSPSFHHMSHLSSHCHRQIKCNGRSISTTVADSSCLINSFLQHESTKYNGIYNRDPHTSSRPVVDLGVEWNLYSTNDKVGTLQICCGTRCIIIQLLHLDMIPPSLRTFLSDDENICFVGVNLNADLNKLGRDHGLEFAPVLELGPLADKVYGKQQFSSSCLVELAHQVVGLRGVEKPTSVSCSDWGAKILTDEQITYAAIHAYASSLIGDKLLGGKN